MALKPRDPRHGTANGYSNHKCRCKKCRAAWAEYTKQLKIVRKKKLKTNKNVVHGRASTYGNHGCRCKKCTTAWTEYFQHRRNRDKESYDGALSKVVWSDSTS